jgi:hypothetical protein
LWQLIPLPVPLTTRELKVPAARFLHRANRVRCGAEIMFGDMTDARCLTGGVTSEPDAPCNGRRPHGNAPHHAPHDNSFVGGTRALFAKP